MCEHYWKNVSACTEDEESGKKYDEHNNCEINARKNNKTENINTSEQNETYATNKSSVKYSTQLNNTILTHRGEDTF